LLRKVSAKAVLVDCIFEAEKLCSLLRLCSCEMWLSRAPLKTWEIYTKGTLETTCVKGLLIVESLRNERRVVPATGAEDRVQIVFVFHELQMNHCTIGYFVLFRAQQRLRGRGNRAKSLDLTESKLEMSISHEERPSSASGQHSKKRMCITGCTETFVLLPLDHEEFNT